MKNALRKDLYILLHRKSFLILLIILTGLLSYMSLKDITAAYSSGKSYQHFFIMITDYSKHSFLLALFYAIPLIAVFPFADTWMTETDMSDVLFTRIKKKYYFLSKYIISFLSGFLLLCIPLLIAFFSEILALDFNDNAISILNSFFVDNQVEALLQNYSFYEFYIQNPYLFIIVFIFMISIFSGLCAITSFSISLLVKQKVLTYIALFFVSLILILMFGYMPVPYCYYFIQNIIQPDTIVSVKSHIYIIWLIIYVIINIIFYYLYKRRDQFE